MSILFCLLIGCLPIAPALASHPSMIYGEDGRKELFETTHRPSLQAAAVSVALFRANALRRTKNDTVRVEGKTYGEEQGLCRNERFYEQPAGAFCSGAVVAPDLVLTAGHCVEDLECRDIRVAFGYAHLGGEHDLREILPEDVMECHEIIRPRGKNAHDFALIRLKTRSAQPPLAILPHPPQPGDPIVLTGYPSGLPLKVVEDSNLSRVREVHMSASLDAFGGNSGSPVTHRDTGELMGILVAGEEDFVDDKAAGCRRARVCRTGASCGSEKILRISAILKQIGGEFP